MVRRLISLSKQTMLELLTCPIKEGLYDRVNKEALPNSPLDTISQDIITAITKAPHSSQIKTEIKESTTVTFWELLYKPQKKKT